MENQRKRKSNEQNTWMNHTNDLKYQIRQHELQGQFENVESKEQVEQAVKQLQVRHSPPFFIDPAVLRLNLAIVQTTEKL